MNNMKMPASYAALNNEELDNTQGGGIWSEIFYALGTMFSGVWGESHRDITQTDSKSTGYVSNVGGGVYTGSGTSTTTTNQGDSWGFSSLGNIFNGIGRLLWIFGV